MDAKIWARRAVLGTVGLGALTMLWGKVRAAQGAAMAAAPAVAAHGPFVSGGNGGGGGGAFGMLRAAANLDSAAEAAPEPEAIRRVVPQGVQKKIVRNASAHFEVKAYEDARRQALAIAKRHGAEVSQDDSDEQGGCKGGTLAFRVAPEKLDALLRDLEPLGRVLNRSVSMQNMTEEYVDLQSRLTAMRRVEKRLSDLLSFKTHRLKDVLEVEKELERVGGEIETILGRMKYIDALAAQSVLTMSLREPSRETSEAPGVLTGVGNSLTRAFNTFVTTGLTLLDMTGFLIAVGLWTLPFAGGLWLAWKRWGTRV